MPASWPRRPGSRFQAITWATASTTTTSASAATRSSAARAVNPIPSPPTKTRAFGRAASPAQPWIASFSSEPWLLLCISSWPSTRRAKRSQR